MNRRQAPRILPSVRSGPAIALRRTEQPLLALRWGIDELRQLPLFEAVRRWIDNEAVRFDIVDEGETLTAEKIREIVHSEAYKEQLLVFDVRR